MLLLEDTEIDIFVASRIGSFKRKYSFSLNNHLNPSQYIALRFNKMLIFYGFGKWKFTFHPH